MRSVKRGVSMPVGMSPLARALSGAGAVALPVLRSQFAGLPVGSPDLTSAQSSFSTSGNAAAFGKCLNLNGTSQYVRATGWIAQFLPGSSWTIRGRLRTTNAGAGPFIFLAACAQTASTACGWWCAVASGKIKLSFTGFTTLTGTTTVTDGNWHDWKIECTNGTSIKLTVDGIDNGTVTGTYPAPNNRDTYLTFGAFFPASATPTYFLAGQIANVAIFDGVASGGVPSAPYAGTEPGLRAYWKFDGDTRNAVDVGMYAATGCTMPVQNISSAANSMSRSRHIAKSDINGLRLGYANFGTVGGAVATASTITAAVEYSGSVYQAQWNGSASVSVPSGMLSRLSDEVAVTIPAGAEFFVRTFFTNASSVVLGSNTSGETVIAAIDVANGEAMSIGTTDQTMSVGAISGGTANTLNTYRPCMIVAKGVTKAFASFGDSRTHGIKDEFSGSDGLKGTYARLVGGQYGYMSWGAPGITLSTFVGDFPIRAVVLGEFASHIIQAYGINDLNTAIAPATILANMAVVGGYWSDVKVKLQGTLTPWTTSTDNWASAGNQSARTWEADRVTVNTGIRAGIAGYSGVLDVADVAEGTRNSGKWLTNGSAYAYTPDGIHENRAMNQAIAAAVPIP